MKDLEINLYNERKGHQVNDDWVIEISDKEDQFIEGISVEVDIEYTPFEAETLESPRVDEELVITQVKAPFGVIDLDCISNLEQVREEMLEAYLAARGVM